MTYRARAADIGDAPLIAKIYNEGIADRSSTFETEPRTPEQIVGLFDGRHQSLWSKMMSALSWP
jgi:L-amino acid N-acyltransferase YncA